MTRIIKSCPFCGSGQVRKRREGVRYKCGKCGETFQVPAQKEAKTDINKMKLPPTLMKIISSN